MPDVLAQYLRLLFGQFFFKFSLKKIVIGKKKIVVPCLDVKMRAFFPRNIQ